MIYAVLLCDKEWTIKRIQRCVSELSFHQGDRLPEMVEDADEFTQNDEKLYSLSLTFTEQGMTLSALVQRFEEGNLVVLSHVQNDAEFIEFNNEYPDLVEWAQDHLEGIYHSEYFQIQKLNNQLIDSQRALIRSKRSLEMALSENQKINEKITLARQAAERANRSKTEFLANMSHDIRTPMNAIVGLTRLMQYSLNDPETLSGYIRKLQSSSEYLLGLINDILDLSKIENGSIELKKEPMNLREVAEHIVAIIRPQAEAGKQKLEVSLEKLVHADVLGDQVRLRQVLMNILSNAVKYTPEGGEIWLKAEEPEVQESAIRYRFTVKDTGIGMSEEFQQHIFEPFARARAMENEIQGTGLGMAITKSIVDTMNGSIKVKSRLGEGSLFEVEIPFLPDKDADERKMKEKIRREKEQKNEKAAYPSVDERAGLEGMHFLCAEDNDLNAEILRSMLELKGATCEIFSNGKLALEAFEKAGQGEYDGVLLDVQMPVMNGYETSRNIRNSTNPEGKNIPIIAMTANAFAEDIRRSLDAGMNAHVTKPVDLDRLEEEITKLVR